MQSPKRTAYLAILIGILTVSFSAILVKLSDAEPGALAFYRMFFSALLMAPVFFLSYRKEVAKLTKRDWLFSGVAGIFLAFHFILWFESLQYTSVASSTVLVTMQPIFAFAGAYFFFKERFAPLTIISAVIAIAGSVIISWGDFRISGSALYGDILALIACALVTAYLLFGQDVRKRLSIVTYTFILYSISAVILFLYTLFKGESFGPYPQEEWVYFLLLAILPTLLGHSLFNWSLKWVSTTVISMAILFEPIGATIMAFFILSEGVRLTQVLGGSIVILGLSLFILDGNKAWGASIRGLLVKYSKRK
ncbi:DMT family transporter [Jeotgalibacillus proteolyticus]|uniref:EamA family transporter n=1 Tax=Jeotgalibacillus proteolyticus TaxID=2082395 RepID=A0A2S5GAE3_9BACL|nr:DMT family transporter [Jeotgalibacillus proteolyticus]PPA69968.1 EamA family transporter [Jeotgalibacillus proteolyticus]